MCSDLARARWWRQARPRVSVIIPFFNDADLTEKAARSVLAQDYQNLELLLVNDGSRDDSSSLQALMQSDTRVTLLSKSNGGTASARNYGLDRASGDYIAFLDSDDVWLPGKLSRQLFEMYISRSEISYTSFFVVYPSRGLGPVKMPYGSWIARYPDIVVKCPVSMSTVVLHRSVFDGERRFKVAKRDCDVPFFVQRAKEGRRFLGIDEPLSIVRYDDDSAIVNWRAQYETIEIFLEIYRSEAESMPELSQFLPQLVAYMEHCKKRHATTGSEVAEEVIRQIWAAPPLTPPQ
jgi:glycosyltransferase involved in cell wall biosynthesis